MKKDANTDHNINKYIKQRWSARAFSPEAVEMDKVLRVLEAARWAPSSMNQQPWRFIVGVDKDETHQKLFSTLVEFNQIWAKAPVLILALGKTNMNMKDEPNEASSYDVGQAVATLVIQATQEDLFVHQMGGFDKGLAMELFNIPVNYKPLVILAIGHYGNADTLPDKIKILEMSPRNREDLEDLVFSGSFGHKTDLFTKK